MEKMLLEKSQHLVDPKTWGDGNLGRRKPGETETWGDGNLGRRKPGETETWGYGYDEKRISAKRISSQGDPAKNLPVYGNRNGFLAGPRYVPCNLARGP
jgi:hypothetical protein